MTNHPQFRTPGGLTLRTPSFIVREQRQAAAKARAAKAAPVVDPAAVAMARDLLGPGVTEAAVAGRAALLTAHQRQETAKALVRARATEAAREKLARERADARRGDNPSAVPVRLDELLAKAPEQPSWRIGGVLKAGTTALVSAPYKTGKSTLMGNLARTLVDGGQFLNRFEVAPLDGPLLLVDNEMGVDQVVEWLKAQGVVNAHNVIVLDLMGTVADWDLRQPENMERAVEFAKREGVAAVVFDCLFPLFNALGIDEYHTAAAEPLIAFDEYRRRASIGEFLAVHHSGHGVGGRARGTSSLSGWPAVLWNITKKTEALDAERYFDAYGRGVDVPRGNLTLGADLQLTYRPIDVQAAKVAASSREGVVHEAWVLEQVAATPGMAKSHYSRKVLRESGGITLTDTECGDVSIKGTKVDEAIARMVADGRLLQRSGPTGGGSLTVNPTPPNDGMVPSWETPR